MPTNKPTKVTILAYQVGFGDCFLLRFHYPGKDRHVLIDFGAHPPPPGAPSGYLKLVADDIAAECNGKLEMVVATHRHQDHISGFATKEGKGPGDVIAGLTPDLVVQPWTEDPDARRDAVKPTASFLGGLRAEAGDDEKRRALDQGRAFVATLDDMETVADAVRRSAKGFAASGRQALAKQLQFYGENNISNKSAVKNLIAMGQRGQAKYVYYGFDLDLSAVLPGVTARVLGPPTLEQTDKIRKYAKTHAEYWSLRERFWRLQAKAAERGAESDTLFPDLEIAPTRGEALPAYVRWLVHRLTTVRGRELLEIVRTLDTWLNNTSVILLFEVGRRKLLFPGDAQVENWRYALEQPGVLQALADVDLYKVGHHGSLNATPRTLWAKFARKSESASTPDRLTTVVSTMKDEHGHEENNTEVPRRTLVAALKRYSNHWTTEKLPNDKVRKHPIPIDV